MSNELSGEPQLVFLINGMLETYEFKVGDPDAEDAVFDCLSESNHFQPTGVSFDLEEYEVVYKGRSDHYETTHHTMDLIRT
jgi:hypothetical protein